MPDKSLRQMENTVPYSENVKIYSLHAQRNIVIY
jgi:hypothetical protein